MSCDADGATEDAPMKYLFNVELSGRELHCIGHIVAQWGFMEHEIFGQTLETFGDAEALPKEMNNLQFTGVLNLWETRVVATASNDVKPVFQAVLDEIRQLKDSRDALVHGMWEWDRRAPDKISTVRIRKQEIIKHNFTADDLADFSKRVAALNFKLLYPKGDEDLAAAMTEQGGYMGRTWVSMMTGNPVLEELLPEVRQLKEEG